MALTYYYFDIDEFDRFLDVADFISTRFIGLFDSNKWSLLVQKVVFQKLRAEFLWRNENVGSALRRKVH